MSQYTYQYVPVRETNGLGVAGFVCSLVGLLVTGGLLCPVGVILSLIALGRRPRGFATAGLVLGLIGTCGGFLLVVAVLAVGMAAVAAVFGVLLLSNPERLELTSDMINIAVAVEHYKDQNRYLPADLNLVGLDERTLTDPWGTQYKYVQEDPTKDFDIVSAGKDKSFDTPDDVKLSTLGEAWMPDGNVKINSDARGGVVDLEVDGKRITITGDDKGGAVKIKAGDRIIEATGDQSGGHVNIGPQTQPAPPALPPSTQP